MGITTRTYEPDEGHYGQLHIKFQWDNPLDLDDAVESGTKGRYVVYSVRLASGCQVMDQKLIDRNFPHRGAKEYILANLAKRIAKAQERIEGQKFKFDSARDRHESPAILDSIGDSLMGYEQALIQMRTLVKVFNTWRYDQNVFGMR